MYNARHAFRQVPTVQPGVLPPTVCIPSWCATAALSAGTYRINLQDETNVCTLNDTEAPVITLIHPTGGEVLPGGTTFRIQWQSDDNVAVAAHTIALSTDAGKSFADPFANLGGAKQTYADWILPSDIAPTRTAVIRVTATVSPAKQCAIVATSDLMTVIRKRLHPELHRSGVHAQMR